MIPTIWNKAAALARAGIRSYPPARAMSTTCRSRSVRVPAVLLLAVVSGCHTGETREERSAELYAYCTQCHGDVGEGKPEFQVPAIAGLPQWYVEAQLDKFRIGARGDHPEDVDGLRMRPMSRTLASQQEVELVSEYVANLPAPPQEATLAGDPERGRQLFTPCVQCHGERAEGKQDMNAPPLTLQPDWYLVAQLQKFKEGIRGTDPLDSTGAQMRPMSLGLADEQAMRDVVAHIQTLE